jgi:hypothetical protein
MSSADDDEFDPNLLRDGESMRVPIRMADAARTKPRDSAAYPRPRRGTFAVDAYGGTEGLHRPGARYETGGNPADGWVRDADRDAAQRARDEYNWWISNQWKDGGNGDLDEDGDDELQGRCAAIRAALVAAGAAPDDAREYVESLDDDEALTGDIPYHLNAFRSRFRSEDTARRQRDRLERLYRARDAELAQAYKNHR